MCFHVGVVACGKVVGCGDCGGCCGHSGACQRLARCSLRPDDSDCETSGESGVTGPAQDRRSATHNQLRQRGPWRSRVCVLGESTSVPDVPPSFPPSVPVQFVLCRHTVYVWCVWQSFCRFGGASSESEMDNVKFAKLARDCGLLTKRCTKTGEAGKSQTALRSQRSRL